MHPHKPHHDRHAGTQANKAFLHRIGRVKHCPASWKDLFFPNVHGREGS